jgi:hypothetical protein
MLHNAGFHNMYCSSNTIGLINVSRTRCTGYVEFNVKITAYDTSIINLKKETYLQQLNIAKRVI